MRWFRDAPLLLGTWLRRLVVLGLVVTLVAVIPLRGIGGLPAWLAPAGTGTVAGSMPPPGASDESEVAAAAKRKGAKHDQGKKDQKAKKHAKRTGNKEKHHQKGKRDQKGKDNGKHTGDPKHTHPGGNTGQHPGNGKGKLNHDQKPKDTGADTGKNDTKHKSQDP